jgi:hypothetical protein
MDWRVDASERSCHWDDCGELPRTFACSGPLRVTQKRAAPHGDLAIAIRLAGEPFADIAAILSMTAVRLTKRMKDTIGVPATTDVHGQERIATRCKIPSVIVVPIGGIGRQRKDCRSLLMAQLRQVQ